MADGIRDKVIRELVDFINEYDESQFIITCRPGAEEYLFKSFTYVEIAGFTREQVHDFSYKWFWDDTKIADRFFPNLRRLKIDVFMRFVGILYSLHCCVWHLKRL